MTNSSTPARVAVSCSGNGDIGRGSSSRTFSAQESIISIASESSGDSTGSAGADEANGGGGDGAEALVLKSRNPSAKVLRSESGDVANAGCASGSFSATRSRRQARIADPTAGD